MRFHAAHRPLWSIGLRLLMVVAALSLAGCGGNKQQPTGPKVTPRYPTLPPKKLPPYLQGTIMELVDVANPAPIPVSGYGLVVNLYETGDTRAPNAVREYMIRMMQKRGFGSQQLGMESVTPQRVLQDPRNAIVRVDGLVPVGAHRGQVFDVRVTCIPGNNTTSLSHGQLYRAELKIDGANPRAPGVPIDSYAIAEGDLFVNPAYALSLDTNDPAARNSLREAVVLGGGVVQIDNPIAFRLRQPEFRLSRMIDQRLDEFLQSGAYVHARDEGLVFASVPPKYKGDWQHFAGVVTHVYFNASPSFVAAKAQELVEEARKPDAPLLDISYCWEALGEGALPFVTPLMTDERPEVAFAAARAAAFIGEVSSQAVLIEMARTPHHPFQLNAVQTLAKLPSTPENNVMLRSLLNSDQTLVRLEAYRALAAANDPAVYTKPIESGSSRRARFLLDIVPSEGPPLVYASRRGVPRLAVFGSRPALSLPVTFTAMDGKLSISSAPGRKTVTIYYRGPGASKPIRVESNPDIAEIAARLGGAGPIDETPLPFQYCDVVAIVQSLIDQQKVVAAAPPQKDEAGSPRPVAFVLQELPASRDAILDAPPVPGEAERPQADSPGTVSSAVPARQ